MQLGHPCLTDQNGSTQNVFLQDLMGLINALALNIVGNLGLEQNP